MRLGAPPAPAASGMPDAFVAAVAAVVAAVGVGARRLALVLTASAAALGAAPPAMAGAWLQEKGSGLLAFSHEANRDRTWDSRWGYNSLYVEYGMTPKLTLGLDAGQGDDADDWKAIAFLRFATELGWMPGQLATEFGAGAAGAPGGLTEPVIRTGLSWGTGFTTPDGTGWINLDARTDTRPQSALVDYKLDITLGVMPNPRTQLTLELWGEDSATEARRVKLSPAVSRRIGKGTWLRLGGIFGIHNDRSIGLVIGSRIEF
ncbi:hypothetical protein JMM63_14935 [Rhodovulum sulfidophilum]|uniref:hypothetical protein n=1 Tax=Rhodovulum sulfidophilum TaxID=35806 RepID=UPI001924759C|nr:hypothetical protein [Rhodovulum sulfidophilum]MBL3596845.1 hypothetical protein [Rhodovulum sulfidophilum]